MAATWVRVAVSGVVRPRIERCSSCNGTPESGWDGAAPGAALPAPACWPMAADEEAEAEARAACLPPPGGPLHEQRRRVAFSAAVGAIQGTAI